VYTTPSGGFGGETPGQVRKQVARSVGARLQEFRLPTWAFEKKNGGEITASGMQVKRFEKGVMKLVEFMMVGPGGKHVESEEFWVVLEGLMEESRSGRRAELGCRFHHVFW